MSVAGRGPGRDAVVRRELAPGLNFDWSSSSRQDGASGRHSPSSSATPCPSGSAQMRRTGSWPSSPLRSGSRAAGLGVRVRATSTTVRPCRAAAGHAAPGRRTRSRRRSRSSASSGIPPSSRCRAARWRPSRSGGGPAQPTGLSRASRTAVARDPLDSDAGGSQSTQPRSREAAGPHLLLGAGPPPRARAAPARPGSGSRRWCCSPPSRSRGRPRAGSSGSRPPG